MSGLIRTFHSLDSQCGGVLWNVAWGLIVYRSGVTAARFERFIRMSKRPLPWKAQCGRGDTVLPGISIIRSTGWNSNRQTREAEREHSQTIEPELVILSSQIWIFCDRPDLWRQLHRAETQLGERRSASCRARSGYGKGALRRLQPYITKRSQLRYAVPIESAGDGLRPRYRFRARALGAGTCVPG